jgi:hypothetical protein
MKGSKLDSAKAAAKTFIDKMAVNTNNRIAFVTFGHETNLVNGLTNNFSSLKSKIDPINTQGALATCIHCGIDRANAEILANGRPGTKKVIVLLTDGKANSVDGEDASSSSANAAAIASAKNTHEGSGTIIYTIGLGDNVSDSTLKSIANLTDGKYYFTPSENQLTDIYIQISEAIAKAGISGFVFNDSNRNGAFNSGEQKLPGWTIQLFQGNSQTPKNAVTDQNGSYAFNDLCDGSYRVKGVIQSGWKQIAPSSPDGHSITISDSSSAPDKNFGVAKFRCSDDIDNDNNGATDENDSSCHSDGNPKNTNSYQPNKDGENGGGNTCADSKDNNGNGLIDGGDPVCHTDGNPNNPETYDPTRPEDSQKTSFNVTLLLHGIGASGDNANPTASSLSNKNPIHTTQSAIVSIYNASDQLVTSVSGQIKYVSTSGDYKGNVELQSPLPSGTYNITIGVKQHLTRLVTGIQTVTEGKANTLSAVHLVTGDANNDNKLDIRDYNLLLDCYSDLSAAPSCNATKKVETDGNDDGFVNQFDYNLFLREISTQPGQ